MDTKSPNYNHKQEVWNSLTHLIGFLFSLSILIMFIVYECRYNIPLRNIYPFYIYSVTMMIMFFVSAFYHSMPLNSKVRAIARIIDHADIFLFVAGTYTPICILGISEQYIGLGLMIVEWSFALIGVILTVFFFGKKLSERICYVIYLLAGWALIFIYPFNQCLHLNVFLFMLAGGIAYSIGAILYKVGSKYVWCHTVFHIFILAAAALQFVGIFHIFITF